MTSEIAQIGRGFTLLELSDLKWLCLGSIKEFFLLFYMLLNVGIDICLCVKPYNQNMI